MGQLAGETGGITGKEAVLHDLIFRYVSVWHCRCSRTAGAYCPSPSAVEPVLMDSQLPDYMQLKRAFLYRSPMEEAISTYSDYLQMCQGQNYDMKSSQVLFPKHCNEAHDELSRYIKKCRDEQTKRAFREVYENLAEKANLTSKKLQIVCPKQTDDLIAEGQALHHCVGTYIERVAAKKCLIVFVRRVEEPKKPYVTVEVRDGKIEQIHGDHNSDPTEEVKKFVDLWSRKVLPMALRTA